MQQDDLAALPVKVGDARQALEPHAVVVAHEVIGRQWEREVKLPGRLVEVQVSIVCLWDSIFSTFLQNNLFKIKLRGTTIDI